MRSSLRILVRPLWRRFWRRIENRLAPIEARVAGLEREANACRKEIGTFCALNAARAHDLDSVLAEREGRLATQEREQRAALERLAALEARISALESTWHEALPAVENALSSVRAMGFDLARLHRALDTRGAAAPASATLAVTAVSGARVRLAPSLCAQADLIARFDALPFAEHSLREIAWCGALECFSEAALRTGLLPTWRSLLAPEGTLRISAPAALFARDRLVQLLSEAGFVRSDAHAAEEPESLAFTVTTHNQ